MPVEFFFTEDHAEPTNQPLVFVHNWNYLHSFDAVFVAVRGHHQVAAADDPGGQQNGGAFLRTAAGENDTVVLMHDSGDAIASRINKLARPFEINHRIKIAMGCFERIGNQKNTAKNYSPSLDSGQLVDNGCETQTACICRYPRTSSPVIGIPRAEGNKFTESVIGVK